MSTQRFCLRWNNHQSNLLSVFDQLLHDESFVDVTLAVDGRYLKAHKIVLSACSPYFQALFVGHPDRHPIVILKDIPYVDMRSLLDFMYRGEVSVDQDRLTLFLKVAESLRIKGLTEVNEDQCDLPKIASSLLSTPLSAGSMSLSYQQRLKRPLSSSQHSLNSSSSSNLQSNNPLLGSALTGPKRKRGLPRKLSGSLAANLDLIPNKPQHDDRLDDDDDRRLGIDPSQFLGRDEDELDEDDEFDEEEEQRSGGMSDSDMIERADSPFDNKMLEVNMSEGGGKEGKQPQHRNPSTEDSPPSEDKEDHRTSSPALSKGGREEDNPSPGPTGDVKPSDAAQLLATNVKQERETSETTSGGDQNETNPSPTPPERFPPGYLQHLLKLKSMDISKRVFDSMFRQNAAGSLPRGLPGAPSDLPKDLSTTPGGVPGAIPFPGSILAGFPPLGSVQPPLPKPNLSEESETSRPLSNPNDDKFYEDMISCSDEEVDEDNMEDDSTNNNNNNDYDADMRQYEYASYKHMERNKRREEQLRGLMGGIRLGDPASGLMTVLGKGSDKYPRTNIEYRTDLGELTIETGASTTPPAGTSTKPHTGRSRKHHSSSSSMSVTPFSSGSTGGASTSATSPRDRSFIDKASVRQFCTQEGEHIFRCNICLKTYTHISNFCRHFLSAHDDRYKQEISCPVCFKMFTRRDNMMTHTKQVHRITLMRGTLQPVYLDQEPNASAVTVPPPPSTTPATSTS